MSHFIPSILRRSRVKEKLPLTPVPPFPSPPKEEENGTICVKNKYNPEPIHLPEEYKDLMHELETKQPPKEVPEQIFDEEITCGDYEKKQQCSIKESPKEFINEQNTRKVIDQNSSMKEPSKELSKEIARNESQSSKGKPSKEPMEKDITRHSYERQCSKEQQSKDPLDIMHEIETKQPPMEVPEQIFEEEITKKVYDSQCSLEEPSKKSLDIMHELETKPPMEVPEQIFDIIREIETKQPPMEVPEQIFEGEGQWRNVHWRF